ncbi:MAG: hypothetical protein NTV30_05305, partial [Chloroflexi bacterium]|nr:hypothetical protein [Chloroflexota bacterium]
KFYYEHRGASIAPDIEKRVAKGEFTLPLYCDFPGIPEHERRVIYGLMIGQEGTTWLAYHNMTRAGFDPDKHLLQIYEEPPIGGGFGWRRLLGGGGLLNDWDLRSSLEGLYGAGDQLFAAGAANGAVTSGRYAGRKAAEYILKTNTPVIDRKQIESEKLRVYAPVKRENGIDWKELASGIAKVMQHYCGDFKDNERLTIGLKWLDELKNGEMKTLYARNPHELARSIEVTHILDWCQAVYHQCLARKSSNPWMQFKRLDYPQADPPEWQKWLTVRQQDGIVKTNELALNYYGNLEQNYQKHCAL